MRITAIYDKYKGCLTSRQAAEAALLGARDTFPDAELCAYECADGGDGNGLVRAGEVADNGNVGGIEQLFQNGCSLPGKVNA